MTKQDLALRFLSLNVMFALACSGAPQEAISAPAEPEAPAAPAAAPVAEPTPAAAAAEPAKAPEPATATEAIKPVAQPMAAKTAKPEAAKPEPVAAPVEPSKPVQGIAVGEPMGKPCGEDGQPLCPLQAFMKQQLDDAVESGDLDKLAAGLKRSVGMAPDPAWNTGEQGWATIAKAGAAAAVGGDLEAARATCKGCHRAWRKKYKEQFRARPL